jgi:CubicO group peptidase (beta-lactamase class C family)
MKTPNKPLVILLACAVLTLSHLSAADAGFAPAKPEEVGLSAERLARLSRVIRQYVDEGKIPGAVTLIARKGKLAHLEAYGNLDREKGQAMRSDAIFRIASMSKAITSVAIMVLQEEGSLLLNDPVSKFIPEFRAPQVASNDGPTVYSLVPARREITIRDLLTHTAGISYGAGPSEEAHKWERVHGWYFAEHNEPIGDAVKRLARLPLVSQPGERYVYGFATDILGHVVEVISGQTLADFLAERIFKPLGMQDTHFYLPQEKIDRFSPVYGVSERGTLDLTEAAASSAYVQGPRVCYSGGAGLLSTATDYARFLQMLLNGGELNGHRVLSRKSVEAMTVNHVGNLHGDQGFGLGFWVTEHVGRRGQVGSVGAYGWGGAYFTTFWVDPRENLVAVFMCQLLPSRGLDLHGKFTTLVYQAIVD